MSEAGNCVLIVDDEPMICESVSAYLTSRGYRVFSADNGEDALEILGRESIMFVILDLMLPGMSGEEICERIRRDSDVPIIMLTAKTSEESILNGLGIGADDYMTKPFSVKQLYARMEAVLRRTSPAAKPPVNRFTFNGDLTVDLENREVVKGNEYLSLTPSEWKILAAMVSRPKKLFSREELIGLVFGDGFDSSERVIDTHVKNLRKKVETDPKNPAYILTVHGIGYRFGGDGR